MKKQCRKLTCIISAAVLVLSGLMFAVSFVIDDIPEKKSYIYESGRITTHSWHDTFENISAIVFMAVLFVAILLTVNAFIQKFRHKTDIVKIIVLIWLNTAICCILIFISNVVITGAYSEDDYNPEYYEFSDSGHTIVIKEESFLLYGGGVIYQVKENNEAFVIGEFFTDDGGRNNGNYEIEWHDDYVEITYNTFNLNGSKVTERADFV